MNKLNIQLACEQLKQGKLIAYPTEAVWGLGCDPNNSGAVGQLLRLKGRPLEKGLILVAANLGQLGALCDSLSSQQLATLESSWPGPTSWLIPDPQNFIPPWIKGDNQSVAVRVSAHIVVQALCVAFGGPIVSTSANVAGKPAIRSRSNLERQFAGKLGCIVSGKLGNESNPSTIKDLVSGEVIR